MKTFLGVVRSIIDPLGARLALVLAISLLPLMLVSIARSQSVVNEALARSQAALVGETLRAVRKEVLLIERARAVAQSLSHSVKYLLDDPELCAQLMKDKLTGTAFSFAGFYDLTGYVPCSSADAPFDFGMSPALESQLADPRPTVLVNRDGPVSGTSVIYASYPVYANNGSLMGFTSISVPHHRLRPSQAGELDAKVLTISRTGAILTAPGSLDEAEMLLPVLEDGQSLITMPTSFQGVGRDGESRLYSVVPVVDGELFAVATWPSRKGQSGEFYFTYAAAFPVLMWLASLSVAWFATSLFVTRYVKRLRAAMTEFARSRKMTELSEFKDAPSDLRDVASAYQQMTDTIIREEARIEDTMRQKDVLLREVHHRVKNNLQLITSIMGMQMRQSRSPEVQRLMRGLHDRVNSLATIHRNLYQTSGQADVQMDEHLKTIVNQVVRIGAERANTIALETHFVRLRLNPDQAVPLSLFVTEAMTNALKYIGADGTDKPMLSVTMEMPDPLTAHVRIINSLPTENASFDEAKSSGLGSELMEAFADQLNGKMTREQSPDRFTVDLTFEIEPLDAKQ